MNVRKKLWGKKAVCLSACLWVKKVELFTFENIWIWLDEPFEIFISDKSVKKHSFSNQPARAKTVDKEKPKQRVSHLMVAD